MFFFTTWLTWHVCFPEVNKGLKRECVGAYVERIEKMFNLEVVFNLDVILVKYNDAYRGNPCIKKEEKKIKINDDEGLRAYELWVFSRLVPEQVKLNNSVSLVQNLWNSKPEIFQR